MNKSFNFIRWPVIFFSTFLYIYIPKPFDSIFLGAVGFPGVPDHISLWGLLIPIRRAFQQYVNVRPIKLLPGVTTPLSDRNPEDIDFIIVRENNEGPRLFKHWF